MSLKEKIIAGVLKQPFSLYQLTTYDPSKPVNMVVGSMYSLYKGWIHSDIETLNLLKESDWQKYFNENSIDKILAEHVWEHLTLEEGQLAFKHCHTYLKQGGFLRVAVPDGFNPSEEYINYVKPGGTGNGADDHKLLYNYQIMSRSLESVGFTVKLLEYFDENGQFHKSPWNPEDGMIRRSADHDSRNAGGKLGYTSLIIDAYKS
ncbi:class I SAM-dependent methyltransferase [Dyadobacter psychrophilus]|uniref:Predicted SAM-depedendent methyltransferase n=1 Tax=Dyadobacter psychrophilus TaxID=651661 RepID=A0A1T5CDC3_9BACT|nr:methyltransferase domain-containing protein [Dyadobacter psychrophilus]SKB57363.1 Predicted SAM-depedendent methyltransferase [Dyadobacter psychrophilus]